MEDDLDAHQRQTYVSRVHKLATFFIMTAGSAKATQFPTMYIVYGGVPFLVAYLTFLATIVMPIMHLESSLGQLSGDGNRGIFSTVPLFMGLGYTMTMYAAVHIIGDSVALSDCLVYFLKSLRMPVWAECNPSWTPHNRSCYNAHPGTPLCRGIRDRLAENFRSRSYDRGLPLTSGEDVVLVPLDTYRHEASGCTPGLYSPLQSYYLFRQKDWLHASFSNIETQPLLSIAAVWMLVFAIAHTGFTRASRFFYIMSCLYVLTTTMLLVRGATLSGAAGGLSMFLYTDWSSIVNLEMWSNALYISLESVGVTGSIYLGIVRFNGFKDKYQEDIKFVLVADTASKGLGTAITFMLLGHLSSSIDIDITMLVRMDSRFLVSITPQAVGIASSPQFWSQVHSMWLLSTMLPKFVLFPDILIEVLSASYPPLVEFRTMAHFFVCLFLIVISVAVCTPGGIIISQVIFHNHDQAVRFIILMLESIVILQFYGVRRLVIDCKAMTNEQPSFFVKLCWTSIIPTTMILLVTAKAMHFLWHEYKSYPQWISAMCVWFDIVELSFIPVFAVVILLRAGLNLRQAVAPLPTWAPEEWEQSMMYRQLLVAEGMSVEKREASTVPQTVLTGDHMRPSTTGNATTANTTSDMLGTNLVVITTQASPGTSGWRYDSDDSTTQPRKKKQASSTGEPPETGTLHKSRRLSSVLASVRMKASMKRASIKPDTEVLEGEPAQEASPQKTHTKVPKRLQPMTPDVAQIQRVHPSPTRGWQPPVPPTTPGAEPKTGETPAVTQAPPIAFSAISVVRMPTMPQGPRAMATTETFASPSRPPLAASTPIPAPQGTSRYSSSKDSSLKRMICRLLGVARPEKAVGELHTYESHPKQAAIVCAKAAATGEPPERPVSVDPPPNKGFPVSPDAGKANKKHRRKKHKKHKKQAEKQISAKNSKEAHGSR